MNRDLHTRGADGAVPAPSPAARPAPVGRPVATPLQLAPVGARPGPGLIEPYQAGRVVVDGKQFAVGTDRFRFRGVTYGTFRPRADGHPFPERQQVNRDFATIAAAGFTVVRTYTAPPSDVVELAGAWGLRLLVGAFFEDWRYLVGSSRRELARTERAAREEVRRVARRFAGCDEVLAICLGNEIPADVVRWQGEARISRELANLADIVRDEDADHLVTYGNYPTTEYLPLDDLDFLTFNVYLEDRADLRRYLTRLQNLAGERPLVLGELGCSGAPSPRGEREQAELLDWQLQVSLDRGVAGTCVFSWTDDWWVGGRRVDGWRFGLTDVERQPRPALAVAEKWNAMSVRDLDHRWPSISVVVCAHNEAQWIDECLRHTCALDYPRLEIIVVDDGSTDGTAELASAHPRAKLVSIPHSGLSAARNVGMEVAQGELIAYLDADAYPSAEWPYFLALALDGPKVGGVGGPNVPPPGDGLGAQKVKQAPGGPVHVLLADDRAEHVPGCNMAFWKEVLVEVGGFDPVYRAAGDDVDLCWRVLERGWDLGFHPAALVWHHRRTNLRRYLRQQRGYGRAEALVEARHPDRFGPVGGARWRGHIYGGALQRRGGVYRGLYASAAYQSVYRGEGDVIETLHQIGVPLAVPTLALAPLALVMPVLGLPALAAACFLLALAGVDLARATAPRGVGRPLRFRAAVAAHHVLQPVARTWGRRRHRSVARRDVPPLEGLPGTVRPLGRGVLLMASDRPRAELAASAVGWLRSGGYHVSQVAGWEDHDGRLLGSALLVGELVTSSHPEGAVQLKVRRKVRSVAPGLVAAAVVAGSLAHPFAGAAAAALAGADLAWGLWRLGPRATRVLLRAGGQ